MMNVVWRLASAAMSLAALLMTTDAAARAAIVTIAAAADSHIQESAPDTTAGELALLRIEGTIGETHLALIWWDVSGVASNSVINDVTFRAIQTNIFVGPGLFIYSIDQGTWDEQTVSWNRWVGQTTSLTHLGLMLVNGSETDGGRSTFNDPDLTALVQGWVDGSRANRGILVGFNGTSTGDTFASREHNTLDPPRLIIDYTIVPEPTAAALLGVAGLLLTLTSARRIWPSRGWST